MSAKLELGIALFILFIGIPLGVWAIRADVGSGETSFTRSWRPTRIWKRDKDPSNFWQQITNAAFLVLVWLAIAIFLLYDALRRL